MFLFFSKKKKKSDSVTNIQKFMSKPSTSTKKDDGLLTYEQLMYWQEHFKVTGKEAGLTPQLTINNKSRRSITGQPHPVKELSLIEWLPWQTTPSVIGTVTHSRRTQHLVELLEFTELHGGQGEDDETYDLEMMSFLNEEDIVKPRTEVDGGLVGSCGDEENDGAVTERMRKKKKSPTDGTAAGEDSDGTRRGTTKNRQATYKKTAKRSGKNVSEKDGCKGTKKRLSENRNSWKEFIKPFDKNDKDFDFDSEEESTVNGGDNPREKDLETRSDADVADLPDVPPEGDERVNEEVPIESSPREKENQEESLPEDENKRDDLSLDLSGLLPTSTPFTGCISTSCLSRLQTAHVPSPPSLDSLEDFDSLSQGQSSKELNQVKPVQAHESSAVKRRACRRRLQDGEQESEGLGTSIEAALQIDKKTEEKSGECGERKNLLGTSTPSNKSPRATRTCNISGSETSSVARHDEVNCRDKKGAVSSVGAKVNFADDSESTFGAGVWCSDRELLDVDTIVADDSAFSGALFSDTLDDDVLGNIDFPSDGEEFLVTHEESDPDKREPLESGIQRGAKTTSSTAKAKNSSPDSAANVSEASERVPSKPRYVVPAPPLSLQKTITKLRAFQRAPSEGCYPPNVSSLKASCPDPCVSKSVIRGDQLERQEPLDGPCSFETRGESTSATLTTEASPGALGTSREAQREQTPVESNSERYSEAFHKVRPDSLDRAETCAGVISKTAESSAITKTCEASSLLEEANSSQPKRPRLSLERSSLKCNGPTIGKCSPDLTSRRSEQRTSKPWSPVPSPESKLKTKGSSVVAVMESDDDDDIRPVGKASSLRRRALSSPPSQEFKKPSVPTEARGQQTTKDRSPPVSTVSAEHDSDEEFEFRNKG